MSAGFDAFRGALLKNLIFLIKHLFDFKQMFNFSLFLNNGQKRNHHTIRDQTL